MKTYTNKDISKRTIDRWIFEQEQRQRRLKRFYWGAYYGIMSGMAVVIPFIPDINWGWKFLGWMLLALIAVWVWAINNAKNMDHTLPETPDEMIMQKKLEERESKTNN